MKICPLCRRKYENAEAGFCSYDRQPLVEEANLAAQSQPPQTNVVAQPFSASLAMGFFAHRFVKVLPPDMGATLPCQQQSVRIDSIQLALNLPMIAFWYLRESNCIRFAPAIGAGGVFTAASTTLAIEVNRSHQTNVHGLEYDLLEIIKRSAPGVTIEAVILQFLHWKVPFPESKIKNRMTEWMIQLGYGQTDTSKPFFSFRDDEKSRRAFEFIPDCPRIASQEQAAQTIQQNWLKFRTEQPDIFHYLSEDVRRAFHTRCSKNTFLLQNLNS